MGSGASIPIVADFKRTLGWTPCWSASASTTTTSIRRTKNTTEEFSQGIRSWARILSAFAEAPR